MCKIINVVVLSLGLIGVSVGQIIQSGQCDDNIQLQTNFNAELFQGSWYEFARADHPQGGDCSTLDLATVGGAITVHHKTIRENFFEDHHGTATVAAGTARLSLNMPTLSSTPIDFWVMLTDYSNFALTYRCVNLPNNQRQIFVWQLSRQPTYASVMIPALMNNTLINILDINSNNLREISHSEQSCYVLPQILPNEPVVLAGQCNPDITVVENFDAGRFLGVWHEIASYYSENALGSCNRAQYSSQDGIVVDVVNSQVINETLFTIGGYATVFDNTTSGKLNVVLEIAPNVTATTELYIIATDYTRWAISYSCENLSNDTRRVFSWIVSRARQLSDPAQAEVNQVVNSILDLNNAYYQTTDQSNNACFYFPDPVANQPRVFGGQCDPNIPVIQNFNAGNYLGTWHDIQSYPTPFQDGTCATADYSPGIIGVMVRNTQVINETLNVIDGYAYTIGTEGKLIVSFPIAGTNATALTDYWIINTDYTSYSLVYSCTNINDYQQQITVWKLSRSKTLSAAANTAINAAMATIPVLDQRFFETMDQTRDGCFFIPEPTGEPVLFSGQCEDDDINVVSDFNLDLFAGRWFEIEAYPKDFQPGQCVDHEFFISSNNSLSLVSGSVVDQLLGTSRSELTFINGTDGRFNLVVEGNTNTSFPYYIVATDYNDYALAYSCVNAGDYLKTVYSWKLSRTKQLSDSANTAINNAMVNETVLSNNYFEPIDQSDYACFYFPDLAPGEPVILPGQCDNDDMPVVRNFNAAEYLGRWRLIESYPSDNQAGGGCNQAAYSLSPTGTVIVYNTEVVNQTLSEAFGEATAVTIGNETIGKLLVTFPGSPVLFELMILDTDYTSYSLVYGCVNQSNSTRRVWSWKMSRTTNLTEEAVIAINTVINNITVLNDRYYETIDHSAAACFYYPEPNADATVVFPGQCDESIPVVTNFDAVGYMGLWHDIERYPAPFQTGTCGNANYDLRITNDGPVVDVFNTQVINQTLDTITGFAVLETNDTSAKLLVTFPVQGFNLTTSYWVLATDYLSYALVYSCANINEEFRSVSSWKLSRSKTLSTFAATEINRIVGTIDVLDDRYYIPQDQSRDGCFYFPEPEPGVPVVFPGRCDVNLTVVNNFNMSLFQGVWHEIEAYPKEEEGGQCINHEFTLNANNSLDFNSYNVIAQSLGITSGTASFSFNDNTGRMDLVFTSNGTVITIPYWIVDTDYENYALAYSCVDQQDNTDFKGVWSWKLSRSKELSNTSRIAIDNAIENIDVLNNMYYEPIDQSNQACFFLPDTNPGEPVIFPGQCDTNITGLPNFDAARYLGLWRLIETYPTEFQLGSCGDATYTLGENGTVVVFNTEVVNQTLSTIYGSAVLAGDGFGKLLVTFPGAPIPSEYFILATDYDNYALVYSCFNINSDQRRVYSWKLSRTNSLSQAALDEINQVVNSTDVLNDRYYEEVDRSYTGCFYYPEVDSSRSVVFRGQCNENITVVTNFDAVGYMGLWHDIQRYPAPFQTGTCGNANYDLLITNDGPVVDVFNTQVINQTLDTINGFAVLDLADANDTSAKLLVTFPVGGINLTTPYWVLATDYNTYALVYSCVNLNAEYKSVSSWKLSRDRSLTPAANLLINNVVNSIDVLDDRYYETQDQSAAGCFYFPEPELGKPVVFPGTCDLNIDVVQNFSFSQFQGVWHEIEAYPKEEQTGQCISHEFTLNAANNLNFESFNVIAESLGVTSGTVSFTSNDNSARLNLVFNSNGTTITIPYWIVDTDYENYALAYSCVNQPNGLYRGVWSWKLSRTKQLSATSIGAINNATQNIDVLNNIYYEPISQTDESCFYYPVLGPGEPVVFPGQCDNNIAAVQNFDATRYLGLWRLIETYPTEFQLGTCNDADYSPGDNGTVLVFNTEVVNETLSTITGSARVASVDGSGKLLVTFPNAPVESEYWILDTDYETYSLVYSCVNINSDQRRVFSWKLSRTNSLPQTAVTAITQTMANINVLDDRYFETVDRTPEGCFYFPEPEEGKPVVFRGQCDDNITVVTNFDAVRYMGTWFDIESYPAPFQGGTCGTANYALDLQTLVVSVVNTQVLNQVLDVQTGTAVLATNDTSAKLLVTFVVNNVTVTTDYWVLATDYDNFALVYSCQNINEEYKQVNSFKLSRARNLTAVADAAIANAINQVQVLDQKYFEDGGQTEEACFYYPDNLGGDVVLPGQCFPANEVETVTGFNANAFTGQWHEVARFPSDLQVGECSATEFSVGPQNNVVISQTEVSQELQSQSLIPGSLSDDGRGVITANITGIPLNTFYILGTDYNEFALVYGCRNINATNKQIYSWKLSRSRAGLSAAANNRIDEIVSDNIDLFEGYFSETDQSNDACFHYPQFDELPAVIELPGPCDESIRGVPSFNAAIYLGRWIEIEKYPQNDQFGTCDRAYYSLGDGNVEVRNTQVVERTLLEQLGYAEVASNDGSGLLNVTFVVNGVTVFANYYILSTDYNTYALVYSCRNLPSGNRQVSSWKLSRTTSLTAQANTAINNVIAQTQGLAQQYYTSTNQTDEACFYVPDLNLNAAPLFRGQCDDNVASVANFDASRFAGWWHEIERYPVDQYRGECISSQYTLGTGNTYQAVDTVVANGTATTGTATVQVLADGRLRRTVNGQIQDTWILATDYDSYALLYSCENVGAEYRRIWSAKHSKARVLTAAAQAAMAPTIESNILLYPQFFQSVDQSDAACFHYPAPGQQVILPGQCDDLIPVERSFDVKAYEGTWYQIERYPQIHEDQTSTCIGARYTLNEATGVVTVLNWEVINGTLETIQGNATIASTDGSAKLTVVLPVVGSPTGETVTTSLYVLTTNYNSYSLAYSCSNINAFQRSIGAWKLSRERSLAPADNTAINTYMANREELHQPYFITVAHDENCEEPSSGAFLRSSIIVMLICALWQILS